MLALPGFQQRVRHLPVRDGARTALAHEIERERVAAQTRALDHIAAQARTQVAGAGGDDHRVDVGGTQFGPLQRALRGRRGEARRMRDEPLLQRVGIDREHLFERRHRQEARLDAVVTLQHGLRYQVRAGTQAPEPFRLPERLPALRLRVPVFRESGAEGIEEHRRMVFDRPVFDPPVLRRPTHRNGG